MRPAGSVVRGAAHPISVAVGVGGQDQVGAGLPGGLRSAASKTAAFSGLETCPGTFGKSPLFSACGPYTLDVGEAVALPAAAAPLRRRRRAAASTAHSHHADPRKRSAAAASK